MKSDETLDITRHDRDGTAIVRPVGEIDLSRAPSLRQFMTETLSDQPPVAVVDLTDVPYMDSSGVATLVEAMQHARRYGGKLILCGLQDKVRSIFEIARLDMVFTIVDSADEALAV